MTSFFHESFSTKGQQWGRGPGSNRAADPSRCGLHCRGPSEGLTVRN